MKFKKEDMGLYFALGLVGAGTGLLVGVFIYHKFIEKPEPEYIFEEDDQFDEETEKIVQKISRMKISEKKEPEGEYDKETLDDFINQYNPNAIQIEMVKKGLLTMDEVKEALIMEELAKTKKPYDYSKKYRASEFPEEKPDLEELVTLPNELEVIDDRWEISSSMTSEKSKNNLKSVYVEDGEFYIKSRAGHIIPMGGLEGTISDEVWAVIEPYLKSGWEIFVNDLESPKHFKFEMVSEDVEESSADNDVVSQ